jgi:hypothetical protein
VTDSASTPTAAGRARPQTGDPQVDEATTPLDALDALPVDEHADVYGEVDTRLRAVMSTAGDSAPEDTSDSPDSADPGA